MNEPLKVGEIAIIQYVIWPEHVFDIGQEVLVTAGLEQRRYYDAHDDIRAGYAVGYWARDEAGEFFYFADQLKRREPPRDELQIVRWADCPWQPEHIGELEYV